MHQSVVPNGAAAFQIWYMPCSCSGCQSRIEALARGTGVPADTHRCQNEAANFPPCPARVLASQRHDS